LIEHSFGKAGVRDQRLLAGGNHPMKAAGILWDLISGGSGLLVGLVEMVTSFTAEETVSTSASHKSESMQLFRVL